MPETTLPAVIIRYRNQAGALVTVTEHDTGSRVTRYTAECAGCLDSLTDGRDDTRSLLRDARKWAGAHAAECRALPQPEPQD